MAGAWADSDTPVNFLDGRVFLSTTAENVQSVAAAEPTQQTAESYGLHSRPAGPDLPGNIQPPDLAAYGSYNEWHRAWASDLDRRGLTGPEMIEEERSALEYFRRKYVNDNRAQLAAARDYLQAEAARVHQLDAVQHQLARQYASAASGTIQAAWQPRPGEYDWRKDPLSWQNQKAARDEIEWAFKPGNERDPRAQAIRAKLYLSGGTMFSPFVPMPPRYDVQLVLKGFGAIPVVGIPALVADGATHYYNGEWLEGSYSLAGAALEGGCLVAIEVRLARQARMLDDMLQGAAPTVSNPLQAGVDFEAQQLSQLGLPKNTTVWRPTVEQTQSAAFKVIVGEAKYTKGGLLRGTTLDATDAGFLEIKGGTRTLNSSYQLRLQTYRSLIEETPYTIRTTRPVNSTFGDWLQRWGVKVEGVR